MSKLSIEYAGRTIECHVQYSWRRTMSIAVKPDGSVVVNSPNLIPLPILKRQIRDKASWIYKKLRFIETHKTKKEQKKYISGEKHFFLGKEYPLVIRQSIIDSVVLGDDAISIDTTRESPVIIKSLLRRWYHDQGVALIHTRYKQACQLFAKEQIIPAAFSYKRMKGKWGTCSHDNTICFNPELIKTPIECIDYVIYHELCHVKHHNHGPYFHKLMSKMMPDWKRRRNVLHQFAI